MPTAQAVAITLGVSAILINIILTSLVWNEISQTWEDFDKQLHETKVIATSVEEGLPSQWKNRDVRAALDGEIGKKTMGIARRRLLRRLRAKGFPEILDVDEETSSDEQTAKPKCQCLSHNTCPSGSPGPKGRAGFKGIPGSKGMPGKPGEDGFDIETVHIRHCMVCPVGPRGKAGRIGAPGAPGPEGPQGDTGERGSNSLPGKDGESGPKGAQGEPGYPGPMGEEGVPAEKIVLTPGEKGPPGVPGPVGPPGTRGTAGPLGRMSIVRGSPGLPGFPGRPGKIGRRGLTGARGAKGENVCECFVYLNEPTTGKQTEQPISDEDVGDIRRSPLTEIETSSEEGERDEEVEETEDQPSPSQIALESDGRQIKTATKRRLYNYNQNGLVNITHIKRHGRDYSVHMTTASNLQTTATTVSPNNPSESHFQYVPIPAKPSPETPVPADIFAKRLRVQGAKNQEVERAYSVENELKTSGMQLVDNRTHKRVVILRQLSKNVRRQLKRGRMFRANSFKLIDGNGKEKKPIIGPKVIQYKHRFINK